jgi:hypothetical protein
MRYLPHTPDEIAEMLAVIGKGTLDELFETIPESVRFQGALQVPPALDEPELMRHMRALAAKNTGASMLSFLGAGMYDHHIPPAVDQLLLRSEFYTAYTPYQPEVSQGTLQAIFEFQTIVSELFGLPLANASLYDGASATAEAALMACRLTKRARVVASTCVHPDYRKTTATYLGGRTDQAYVEVEVGANGTSTIWGMQYIQPFSTTDFRQGGLAALPNASAPPPRIQSIVRNDAVVFGVSLAQQPTCFTTVDDAAGDDLFGYHGQTSIQQVTPAKFELVMHTSPTAPGAGQPVSDDTIELEAPTSFARVVSWASIIE